MASGRRTTPSGCTSIAVSRRSVRVARRAKIVVTVRRGGKRVRGARVVLKAKRLHKRGRTNRRGRARFVVRAVKRHTRITVRVAANARTGCGRPVAYVRVRR